MLHRYGKVLGEAGNGVSKNISHNDCAAGDDSWDIELIKEVNYDMQCPEWEMKEDKDGLV